MSSTDNNSGDGNPNVSRCTRRTVLHSGAAVGLTAGLGGVAAGQETTNPGSNITTLGIIPEQEQIGQNLRGFWIHLGPEVDPIQASVADQCDIVDWTDQETRAFDAMLIDRKADPEQSQITLYLHDRVDIGPGTLFIVNDVDPCQSGYIGLSLEQIGSNQIQVGPRATELGEGTETTDGFGPGFGLLAGVGGLLGGGWLFGRSQRRERE